jgi:hypothetical protein
MMRRDELLGELSRAYEKCIGVSGTHGKTTTTGLISEIFQYANRDATIHIGGVLPMINSNVHLGKGDTFITEACEYVDSFLTLSPTYAIVLNIDADHLDYFKDIYLDFYHRLETVNGLLIKVGATMHWRSLTDRSRLQLAEFIQQAGGGLLHNLDLRAHYNSFAPRLRIEWTPGLYYYMNGRRKMNIGSSMPTFVLDYERGFKGVLGSTDEHERVEFDVMQKIKLNQIRTLGYRAGFGIFTRKDNVYFVDFVNFKRSNIPEDWNDEIGGTFQLLDRQWYNSSRQYWRGHVTYESPFILLRPLNRWLGMIQQERLYGGVLFMPHLNPYVELGYGIGTHIFDVGAFVSSINGKFDTVGFKFTFELFND